MNHNYCSLDDESVRGEDVVGGEDESVGGEFVDGNAPFFFFSLYFIEQAFTFSG